MEFLVTLVLLVAAISVLGAFFDWVSFQTRMKGLRDKVAKSDMSTEEKIDFIIRKMGEEAFQVKYKSDSQIQMVRPKKFSFIFALLWFLVGGIGIIVYIIWYMAKQDTLQTFSFDKSGQLVVN